MKRLLAASLLALAAIAELPLDLETAQKYEARGGDIRAAASAIRKLIQSPDFATMRT